MANALNLGVEVRFFLCLEYPTVINATIKIIIIGCSRLYKRKVASFIISPTLWVPENQTTQGDAKKITIPINNWICVTINANNEILKSLGA